MKVSSPVPCRLSIQKKGSTFLGFSKISHVGQVVVADAFNPSTREAEEADLCEFKASLVYKS